MRHAVLATAALLALAACTTRPARAKGPTLPWDTANSVVRKPSGPVVRPSGAPSAAGTWHGTLVTSAGERQAELTLAPDGTAHLQFTPAVADGPNVLTGGWGREATWVRVEFSRRDTTDADVPVEFDLGESELVPATQWDRAVFGGDVPRFVRR